VKFHFTATQIGLSLLRLSIFDFPLLLSPQEMEVNKFFYLCTKVLKLAFPSTSGFSHVALSFRIIFYKIKGTYLLTKQSPS
jgi:hypothetical protein